MFDERKAELPDVVTDDADSKVEVAVVRQPPDLTTAMASTMPVASMGPGPWTALHLLGLLSSRSGLCGLEW